MPPVAPLDPTFELEGPLESATFPETLSARVVTPGDAPRLHGYDVEGDLARHYDPTDILFLSLTGELPPPEISAALRIALTFLAPVSIAHASVHAATLARLCGTTTSSTLGIAAIGLAEQARVLLDEHADLLAWLARPQGAPPEAYRAVNPDQRASGERLRRALVTAGLAVPDFVAGLKRDAALLCVLFRCGLTRVEQLEAAIVSARLPSAFAEALTETVVDFAHYPIKLPDYRYRETP
ncbi:MAG TPA: hypothetical protein VMI54_05300 [Polyangiaceae bacterium]|nr:hypothetical protein [Polyangiaceae bacterium]